MNQDDHLRKLLKDGENETCEFKLSLAVKENAAKAICAMANTSGGSVVIGIAELKYYSDKMPAFVSDQLYANEYIIYGVSDDDRDRRELASHLRDTTNFRASIEKIYKASSVSFCGKKLIVVDVAPLFARNKQLISYKGKVYRRLDNQSVSLNVDELVDLMSATGQPIQIVPQNTQVAEDDVEVYENVKKLVRKAGKASTSLIQRKLRIGYGRASRYIDRLEADGIISPADGSGPREILKQKDTAKTELHADDSNESMYEAAVRVSVLSNRSSTSFLQRRLRIGYGRAAKLLELMEQNGIVAAADGSRPRTILITDVDEALERSRR